MARALTHSLPSNSLEAAVRVQFGLSQAELARYLGVSAGLVAHLEAGRRRPTATTTRRLNALAQLLPPPEGTGPAAAVFTQVAAPTAMPVVPELPALGELPPAPAPLRKQHTQVLAQAAQLRWALHRAGKGDALQQRRQWGLAILQAGLASPAPDPAEQDHRLRWLATLTADIAAAAPTATTAATRALAIVRLLALDIEAATLAQLLATD